MQISVENRLRDAVRYLQQCYTPSAVWLILTLMAGSMLCTTALALL